MTGRHLISSLGAVFVAAACLALAGASRASAQNGENGFPTAGVEPAVRPAAVGAPATTQPPAVAAKVLFGAVKVPAPTGPQAIGGYARGCLAGGKALPIDGPAWQAMRLSRNRNWGHPALIAWLEKFAVDAQKQDGWSGLLVGDLAQPRGGPMLTGHASHQIGLDADIWLTPMPNRRLSTEEREEMSAVSMLGPDQLSVNPEVWTERHARIIKRAASSPRVERIFVHPGIKKALCEGASALGPDKAWLSKVRAYWGHHYHFHVRIGCPKDSPGCTPQAPVTGDDGCGAELAGWFKLLTAPKPPPPPGPPKPPPPPMTLAQLPAECRVVLETGISKGIVRTTQQAPAAAAKD